MEIGQKADFLPFISGLQKDISAVLARMAVLLAGGEVISLWDHLWTSRISRDSYNFNLVFFFLFLFCLFDVFQFMLFYKVVKYDVRLHCNFL